MLLIDAHNFFNKTFGISLNLYLDGVATMLAKKPIIDIYKFDEWLHDTHGDYERDGMSMFDVLVENYDRVTATKISDLVC